MLPGLLLPTPSAGWRHLLRACGMSSRAVRALYRLFLRQARALDRSGVTQLDVRAPVSKGESRRAAVA